MKLKSPFNLFSLSAPTADLRGNYANPQIGKYKPTTFKHPKLSDIKNKKGSIDIPEIGDTDITPDPYVHQFPSSPRTGYDQNENRTVRGEKTLFSSFKDGGDEARAWIAENPDLHKQMLKDKSKNQQRTNTFDANDQKISSTEWMDIIKSGTGSNKAVGQMKGSPNKLIGDTMDPYGQINPGAVPPNQAQNDLGAQPIIGAQGSQPSARAIDMAAIGNPYATPGADFDPQSKMKAESIFGSPMQRQGLMNLGTPLHHDSEKQAHTHPSRTTTKMKPDGEYPGARYVKGDLVDQDDLLDKTELDVHIATQVQSDKKGSFIKEMPDSGPGSDIETDRGFGKKIRLESMGRSSYTSNMKDQMDPHNFLFKNTPKK